MNNLFNSNFKNANIDPRNGVRYGIINANKIYVDDIFCNGLSICYVEALCDILQQDFNYNAKEYLVDPSEYEFIYNYYSDLLDHINTLDRELVNEENGEEFYLDPITDGLAYTLEERKFIFLEKDLQLLFNLDSNVITVLKSNETGYFDLCSPCYPNAVDLNSIRNEDEGYLGYVLPKEWYITDEE